MSNTYTDLTETNYPDSQDVFENKSDVSADMYRIVNQYKTLLATGDVASAAELLADNPALASMVITAADFNKLQHAMMAMERYMKSEKQQIVFSDTEPTGETAQVAGDIWMKTTDTGVVMYEKTTEGTYIERQIKSNTVFVSTAGTDLNNYKEDGFYYFSTSYTPANIPVGASGWLLVIKSGLGHVKQLWFCMGTVNVNDHYTYMRTCNTNGVFGNWAMVMTDKGGEFTGNAVAAFVAGNQSGIRNMIFFDKNGAEITDNISMIKCYDK